MDKARDATLKTKFSSLSEMVQFVVTGILSDYNSQSQYNTLEEYVTKEKIQESFGEEYELIYYECSDNNIEKILFNEKNNVKYLATYSNNSYEVAQVNEYKEGKLSDLVTPEHYGEKIFYKSKNGLEEWCAFYNNNSDFSGGDGNVFIISKTYVNSNLIIPSVCTAGNGRLNKYNSYNIFCRDPYYTKGHSNPSLSVREYICEQKLNSDSNLLLRDKFLVDWSSNSNFLEDGPVSNALGWYLDSSLWTSFLDDSSYATDVIGGPTAEMFVASWNQTHDGNEYDLYLNGENSIGYDIKLGIDGTFTNWLDLTPAYAANGGFSSEGDLYIPERNTIDGCAGYWILSPSSRGDWFMICIRCWGSMGNFYCDVTNNGQAVRPVICLKENIDAIYIEDLGFILK